MKKLFSVAIRNLVPLIFLIAASTAFSHEGSEASAEQYLGLYQKLFQSIQEFHSTGAQQKAGVPFVYAGQAKDCTNEGCYYFSGDAVSEIIQHALDELEAGDAGRSEEIHQALKKNRIFVLSKLHSWLISVAKFGLEIPGVMTEGARQYGLSYAIYTLLTESIEHTFIPFPFICKLLQGVYFATIGKVANFASVLSLSQNWEVGLWARVQAAYTAVRMDWAFKGRIGNRAFRKSRYSGVTQREFNEYLSEMEESEHEAANHAEPHDHDCAHHHCDHNEELDFAMHYLAQGTFWSELLARAPSMDFPGPFQAKADAAIKIPDELANLAKQEAFQTRLWKAYRIGAFFQLFKDLLAEGTTSLMMTKATANYKPANWLPFCSGFMRYISTRWTLGGLGKLLDLFRSALYTAALNPSSQSAERTFTALGKFAEQRIFPILAKAQVLIKEEQPKEQKADLSTDIKKSLKELEELMKQSSCQTPLLSSLKSSSQNFDFGMSLVASVA